VACGYDWCYDLLSADQRAATLTRIQQVMDNRDIARKIACLAWFSSNNIAGPGMTLALATHGEFPGKDYVADYYENNWWKAPTSPPDQNLFNWWFVRNNLAGGGNREGFGYFWGVLTNWVCKAAFESATAGSDQQLGQLAYFNQYPYWILFQTDPAYKKGTPIWSLPTITYSNELDYDRSFCEFLMCSTSWSDEAGRGLARWLLDQTMGYVSGAGSVGRLLLFGLLIGDPRVVGASPSALNLPLEHVVMPYGEFFQRTDWTAEATCLYFGCATHQSRVYPMNDFTLWSKGVPLLPHRMPLYQHDYGPAWMRNIVCFVSSAGAAPALPAVDSSSQIAPQAGDVLQALAFDIPENDPGAKALGSLTKNADGSWTGDCTGLWTNSRGLVKLSRRTVTPAMSSQNAGSITIVDEVVCDQMLTPHICWNTPNQPLIAMDAAGGPGTVTLANGGASCVMTFDRPPAKILAIGGPGHEIDDLNGKPWSPNLSQYENPNWLALNEAGRLRQGGYWRVHVVLPAGGGKLTTTIRLP